MGFIFSCIPYKNIDFQIMRPAQIKLGPGIETVNIHCEYCGDSSENPLLFEQGQAEELASRNFIFTLSENLQKSPLFTHTKFSILASDTLIHIIKNSDLRRSHNGIVIILDSVRLIDTLLIKRDPGSRFYFYNYSMIHDFGCRVYNITDMSIIDRHIHQDTLFWPGAFYEQDVIENMPSLTDAVWDTGIKGGEWFAKYLAPYWMEQSRTFFFGGNQAFKNAYNCIQQNMLDSALNILQTDAKTKTNRNTLAKNLYNSAVIYELKDDLENALSAADSSYSLSKSDEAKEYVSKLRIRKLDKTALDWQLN